jgi:hypothetical protein
MMLPVRGAPSGRARAALVMTMLSCGATPIARAQQALVLRPLGTSSIRIDGDVREWLGARWERVGNAADGSLQYTLAFDAQAVYVGARVLDDQLVRTSHPSPAEDAIVLTFAMPRAAAPPLTTEVWLYAGIPGKQAAQAALGSAPGRLTTSTAITIAEGPWPGKRGYVLEARIPWSAIAGSDERAFGRAAIALHDVDGKPGARATTLCSAPSGAAPPPMLAGDGGNAAIASFLHAKELDSDVRYDLLGDVSGDARLERVVLAGTFAVVAGPEIKVAGGEGYGFLDLPVPLSSDVLGAELRDATGDHKADLVVRLRQEPDAPRIYRWDGMRWAAIAAPRTRAQEPVAARVAAAPARAPEPERVVQPAPPGADELIAAFRQARGIEPSLRPRFVQHVNVAGDERLESLMLFGKDLLVIGKGYRGGTGYFFSALPVRDAADISRMFTADLSGDGRCTLFVRFVQVIGDVRREILLAYRLTEQGMTQLLAVEVRREQGSSNIANAVELVPDRGHQALRISPGSASGWDERSYPFVADSGDGYGPLLLPWKDRALRYRLEGERLVGEAGR